MNDYIGKPTTIEVGEKKYKLGRLTRAIRKEFLEYARECLPDPIEAVASKLSLFPAELQREIAQQAVRESSQLLDFTSPRIRDFMDTLDGRLHMVKLLLKEHHPDLTDDDVFDIGVAYAQEQGATPEDSFRTDPATV